MRDYIATNVTGDEIVEDEKNLFGRSKIRTATVVEYESNMGG